MQSSPGGLCIDVSALFDKRFHRVCLTLACGMHQCCPTDFLFGSENGGVLARSGAIGEEGNVEFAGRRRPVVGSVAILVFGVVLVRLLRAAVSLHRGDLSRQLS